MTFQDRVARFISSCYHCWSIWYYPNKKVKLTAVPGSFPRDRAAWDKYVVPMLAELRLRGHEVEFEEGVEP